jgi:hypothetical protein
VKTANVVCVSSYEAGSKSKRVELTSSEASSGYLEISRRGLKS